jgi:hypothetical protein
MFKVFIPTVPEEISKDQMAKIAATIGAVFHLVVFQKQEARVCIIVFSKTWKNAFSFREHIENNNGICLYYCNTNIKKCINVLKFEPTQLCFTENPNRHFFSYRVFNNENKTMKLLKILTCKNEHLYQLTPTDYANMDEMDPHIEPSISLANDFNSFCDDIDAVLEMQYHESINAKVISFQTLLHNMQSLSPTHWLRIINKNALWQLHCDRFNEEDCSLYN